MVVVGGVVVVVEVGEALGVVVVVVGAVVVGLGGGTVNSHVASVQSAGGAAVTT